MTRFVNETANYWQNIDRDHDVEYTTNAFRDFVSNDLTNITLSNVNPINVSQGHVSIETDADSSLLTMFTSLVFGRGIGLQTVGTVHLRLNNFEPNEEIRLFIAIGYGWGTPANWNIQVNGVNVVNNTNVVWLTRRYIIDHTTTANSSGEINIILNTSSSQDISIGGIITLFNKEQEVGSTNRMIYKGTQKIENIYKGTQKIYNLIKGNEIIL